MAEKNLLAHLVCSLTNGTELAATTALVYLARPHSTFMEAFRGALAKIDIDLPGETVVTGQAVAADLANRPDVVGVVGERIVFALEAKFGAPLTPQQPCGYFDGLEDGGTLLFVVPARRADEVWLELLARCRSAGHAPKENRAGERHRGATVATWKLALVTWERLMEGLDAAVRQLSQPDDGGDYNQFSGLVRYLVDGPSVSLTHEQPSTAVRDLLERAARRICEAGLGSTQGYRMTPSPVSVRRYLTLGQQPDWCIAWDPGQGKRAGRGPVWLLNTSGTIPQPLVDKLVLAEIGAIVEGKLLSIPVDLQFHEGRVNEEEAIQIIMRMARSIVEMTVTA